MNLPFRKRPGAQYPGLGQGSHRRRKKRQCLTSNCEKISQKITQAVPIWQRKCKTSYRVKRACRSAGNRLNIWSVLLLMAAALSTARKSFPFQKKKQNTTNKKHNQSSTSLSPVHSSGHSGSFSPGTEINDPFIWHQPPSFVKVHVKDQNSAGKEA